MHQKKCIYQQRVNHQLYGALRVGSYCFLNFAGFDLPELLNIC